MAPEKKKFNLKGLFIQSNEEETTPAPVGSTTPTLMAPAMHQTTKDASVDPAVSASLTKALEDANLPSYDYLEFAEAVDQQASIIPDESTRFKSVAMIAKQMGATPDKLVDAANQYLAVLKSQEQEFVKAMQNNLESVDGVEKELLAMDVRIGELQAEMAKLQEGKKAKMDSIAQNRAKIETVKANFYATLEVFTGKITADIDKIKRYLIQK